MTLHNRRAFLNSLCLAGAASVITAHAATKKPHPPTDVTVDHGQTVKRPFLLFDALLYDPMPKLKELGMPKLLNVDHVWRPGISEEELDPIGMADYIRFINRFTDHCYFDLEAWTFYGNPTDLEARIHKHLRAVEIMRETAPTLKFGFYSVLPTVPYWPIALNYTPELTKWHAVTERTKVIADKVDYLFPSLYTFYDDPKGWEVVARAAIKEARRYSKPVYPFLWPRYHDSNKKLRLQPVPAEAWRRQLEICRECADGAVLWGGYKELWDEEAPWWLETKAFLQTLDTPSISKG